MNEQTRKIKVKQHVGDHLYKCLTFWNKWKEELNGLYRQEVPTFPLRKEPLMVNNLIAEKFSSNILSSELDLAIYNMVKLGIFKEGYTHEDFEVFDVELQYEKENTNHATKRYKSHFMMDKFSYRLTEKYSRNISIMTEENEDDQFGGSTCGSAGFKEMLSILSFIESVLLDKFTNNKLIVDSASIFISD